MLRIPIDKRNVVHPLLIKWNPRWWSGYLPQLPQITDNNSELPEDNHVPSPEWLNIRPYVTFVCSKQKLNDLWQISLRSWYQCQFEYVCFWMDISPIPTLTPTVETNIDGIDLAWWQWQSMNASWDGCQKASSTTSCSSPLTTEPPFFFLFVFLRVRKKSMGVRSAVNGDKPLLCIIKGVLKDGQWSAADNLGRNGCWRWNAELVFTVKLKMVITWHYDTTTTSPYPSPPNNSGLPGVGIKCKSTRVSFKLDMIPTPKTTPILQHIKR